MCAFRLFLCDANITKNAHQLYLRRKLSNSVTLLIHGVRLVGIVMHEKCSQER